MFIFQSNSNSNGGTSAVQGVIRELIGQLNTHLNNAEVQSGHTTTVSGPTARAGGRSVLPSGTNVVAIQEHRRLFTRQSVSDGIGLSSKAFSRYGAVSTCFSCAHENFQLGIQSA